MRKEPLVSIITCIFNQSQYFGNAIQSVLNQTYKNWEWIILDDGSTDHLKELIKQFNDGRIKYFYQEHAGIENLTKTFNKALLLCNGTFVATLDGDDYWSTKKLDLQVNEFLNKDVILSYGEAWLINHKGEKCGYINIPQNKYIACNNPIGSALERLLVENSCFIVNSTVMYKRENLISIGGFIEAEGLLQDFTTWLRLSLDGHFSAISECLGYYRKQPSSISLRDSEKAFDNQVSFLKNFIIENQQKLKALNISYDLAMLEKQWLEKKTFLSFNNALYFLMNGAFDNARTEYKKFLQQHPSLKNRLIYYLLLLSNIIECDLVNPIMCHKQRLERLFNRG